MISLEVATPDEIVDMGRVRAAMYELDVTSVDTETAALVVSHTCGRIGAAYKALPTLAHYLNVYVGTALPDEVRQILFPQLGKAAHSTSVQERPAKPITRRHGALHVTQPEAERLIQASPVALEMFAIGPIEEPITCYGFSVKQELIPGLAEYVARQQVRLTWLTK